MNRERMSVSGDGVFYTLQGEGISTGEPASFLRLHFCNLQCTWCDTPYTWDKTMPEFTTEMERWTIDEAVQKVEDSWACQAEEKPKRLVITGGEPMIQRKKIDKLMDALPDWKFEIETNGTIMPTEKQLTEAQINCSPKLDNSGNSQESRINPDVIKAISEHGGSFKFVVAEQEDLDEIEQDFIQPFGINVNQVILMPLGTDTETLRDSSQQVAEYAKEKGYRLMGRLQVELWGDERGV